MGCAPLVDARTYGGPQTDFAYDVLHPAGGGMLVVGQANAPGLLEEIRGIADACESEYDLVLANMTVSYWELSACNVIAVSGSQCRNGKTIFARNHDWLDEDQEWVTCFRTHASTGIPHIGFGFQDVGRSGGVNKEGLAISSAAIWYQNKPKPGLRSHLPTRWVLDTYSDTPSAVDYLQRIPHHEGGPARPASHHSQDPKPPHATGHFRALGL